MEPFDPFDLTEGELERFGENMDFDIEENFTLGSNITSEVYGNEGSDLNLIVLSLFSIVCLLSFAADVILATVILKYPKLRQNTYNVIFLNYCLFNAIYLIITPIAFIVANYTDHYIVIKFYCMIDEFNSTLLLTNLLQIPLMAIYWLTENYHPNCYLKLVHNFRIIIASLYIGIFLCFGIFIDSCINYRFLNISPLVLLLGFVSIMLFQTVINVYHMVKRKHLINPKSNVAFYLSNIYVFSWIPAFITFIMMIFGFHIHIFFVVFYIANFLNPIVNLLFLYYFDHSYGVFLREILVKCRGYKNESLDENPITPTSVDNDV